MAIRTRNELIQEALRISDATNPNEISALQTGTLFEDVIDSSLQRGDLAFDGNRAITAPGFENIMASGSTVQDFLESVFFPAQTPLVSLTGGEIREFGDALATLNVTLNVTPQTNPIAVISLAGENIPTNGGAESFNRTVPIVPNQDTTITARVTDSASMATTASTNLTYRHRRFAFTTAMDVINATDLEISEVINTNIETSDFSISRARIEVLQTSSEFICFAYLAEFGQPTVNINGFLSNSAQVRTFTYTNQFGFEAEFILVCSGSVLDGDTPFVFAVS